MKVIITPRAETDIAEQQAWGIGRFGPATADRTFERVADFLEKHLSDFPRAAGNQIPERDLWEAPVPGTPFINFYRIEPGDIVRVLALFHHAQNRSTFQPP